MRGLAAIKMSLRQYFRLLLDYQDIWNGYILEVVRYLKSGCDTYRDTLLMLRLIDYQAKIKEA